MVSMSCTKTILELLLRMTDLEREAHGGPDAAGDEVLGTADEHIAHACEELQPFQNLEQSCPEGLPAFVAPFSIPVEFLCDANDVLWKRMRLRLEVLEGDGVLCGERSAEL